MTEPAGTPDQASTPTGPGGGRRRLTVIAGVCLTLLVLGGGAAAAFGHLGGSDRHDVGAAATRVPARGAVATPSVEPNESASPSLSAVPAPTSTAPSNAPAATRPTARATAIATPAAPKPTPTTCQPNGYAQLTKAPGYDGVTTAEVFPTGGTQYTRLCPGERVRVFWASYQLDADGSGHLIGSQEYWLDAEHSSVEIHILVTSDPCTNPWFIARGNDAIPQTLAPGGEPFTHWLVWSKGNAEPGCS